MTESNFMDIILNASDEEFNIYAKECLACCSYGFWNKNDKIYSLLCEYSEWNCGDFIPALNIIVEVALEFMKRNVKE